MKVRISIVFFVALFISIFIPLMASANESEYSVYINGKELNSDYAPITKNNAVYVPLWAVLGQLNMSTEDYNGVLKINHPNRILMVISDQNILTYIGRKGDVHSTRLEYPIISENYVMYTPLTFLSEYFDMQVAYGENGRIDITIGDLSKDVAWATPKGYNYTLDTIAKKFKLYKLN
ncbi:hypothetical protein OB236_10820 [Paenibacillus sp. WQ 127069]|uniref:Copper amine oxidase-like N-terminal domain-containing protein n=1 Tax=Paenibacillus baimaensis TaxID=2982185 RepID=A0ABT2UFF4_9BACL|nr:hypothetical protein [Paenibacillus sp. WQ 127069]MCU6792612.1 hypothetical protein [Paenibacillus sp. WQ 127069]